MTLPATYLGEDAFAHHPEHQYLNLLRQCLDHGVAREGRNGVTYGLFGAQMRFDLSQGFPLLTTKKMFTRGIVTELLWFLRGDTNIKYLHDHGVHIWDEWANKYGNLGPIYGQQWRGWRGMRTMVGKVGNIIGTTPERVDQIERLINGLRDDPHGRRHIITAWNPIDVDQAALPPCHCLFQFHVANGKLSCHLYQRSGDVFLGVPFNIASYALLTHLIAHHLGYEVGDFIHSFGDVHLYANHVDQAREQLSRDPLPLPKVHLAHLTETPLNALDVNTIQFLGYTSHPAIKADVSA